MAILAQAMLEMWFQDLQVLVTVSDASRAAGRAGYACRRKQLDSSCEVYLLCAVGRFLQMEAGWSVSDLLERLTWKCAILVGGKIVLESLRLMFSSADFVAWNARWKTTRCQF